MVVKKLFFIELHKKDKIFYLNKEGKWFLNINLASLFSFNKFGNFLHLSCEQGELRINNNELFFDKKNGDIILFNNKNDLIIINEEGDEKKLSKNKEHDIILIDKKENENEKEKIILNFIKKQNELEKKSKLNFNNKIYFFIIFLLLIIAFVLLI